MKYDFTFQGSVNVANSEELVDRMIEILNKIRTNEDIEKDNNERISFNMSFDMYEDND